MGYRDMQGPIEAIGTHVRPRGHMGTTGTRGGYGDVWGLQGHATTCGGHGDQHRL